MNRFLLCLCLAWTPCLAGCQTVWMEAEEVLEFSARGVQELWCKSENGRLELIGDPDARVVSVRVRKEVRGADANDAEAALAALQVVGETRDGRLELAHRWSEGFDDDWRSSVSFRVVYPRSLATVVRTENGDIRVRGARHRCQASSRNGAVLVQGAVSWMRIRSTNGRVTVKLSAGGGRKEFHCDIQTVRGAVDLVLDPLASARLSCATRVGLVDCDFPLKGASRRRGSVDGVLGSGLGSIKIRTNSGGIKIRPRPATL